MGDAYPDDADGDALRRVAALGAEMSRPTEIDFFVAVADREAADAVARLASIGGYHTEVVHDGEDDSWDFYCTKTMLPTYDGVVAAQRELDELSGPIGGRTDGWGTSGK